MKIMGRPRTGKNYESRTMQLTQLQWYHIQVIAKDERRSTAQVIRNLIDKGLESLQNK